MRNYDDWSWEPYGGWTWEPWNSDTESAEEDFDWERFPPFDDPVWTDYEPVENTTTTITVAQSGMPPFVEPVWSDWTSTDNA